MSRFVRPQTRTLTLANGDQLIVRERLTAGEQRAQYARMYAVVDGRPQVIPFAAGVGVVLAYLLDWTLADESGQRVEIRDLAPDALQQVIDALDTTSFHEIRVAIEAHEAAMLADRAQKKTTPDGGTP
ncbi:MAG: hypothetical protein EHM91_00065 [Planctomycetota bacterium]|nr:MAG: hypothetical protein EHM91_00065 [Planctomycetota bacterium]